MINNDNDNSNNSNNNGDDILVHLCFSLNLPKNR